jgi:hypothetical protein
MNKCFRPEIVRATAGAGEVLHISGIRSHAPALGAAVVPPWPRQPAWHLLRETAEAGKAGKP